MGVFTFSVHFFWFETCVSCNGSFIDAGDFRELAELTMSEFFKRIVRHRRYT